MCVCKLLMALTRSARGALSPHMAFRLRLSISAIGGETWSPRPRGRGLKALVLVVFPLLGFIGGDISIGEAPDSANPDQALSSVPPYVRRGDEVEARYRAYRERLERFYDRLAHRLKEDKPDLYEKLKDTSPKPVVHGYQVLPRIVANPPKPATPPRAISTSFSWRRTD